MTHRFPPPDPGEHVRSYADSEPFRYEVYLRDGSGAAYPGEPVATGRSFWADFRAAGDHPGDHLDPGPGTGHGAEAIADRSRLPAGS